MSGVRDDQVDTVGAASVLPNLVVEGYLSLQDSRQGFWYWADSSLLELVPDADERAKITAKIEQRVPRPDPAEQPAERPSRAQLAKMINEAHEARHGERSGPNSAHVKHFTHYDTESSGPNRQHASYFTHYRPSI